MRNAKATNAKFRSLLERAGVEVENCSMSPDNVLIFPSTPTAREFLKASGQFANVRDVYNPVRKANVVIAEWSR